MASTRYVPALGRDSLTSLYDPILRLTTRERTFKERLLDQADLEGAAQVLDLGCGTGTLTTWIKQRVPAADVVGLDGDPDVLRRARAKAARGDLELSFDQGLSFELPYPDASFDRVLSSLLFHHLGRADKARTLLEVWRVLRPDGQLHVADWGAPTSGLMRTLFHSIQLLDGRETTQDNVDGRLPGLIVEAGFVDVVVRGNVPTIYGTLSLLSAGKPAVA